MIIRKQFPIAKEYQSCSSSRYSPFFTFMIRYMRCMRCNFDCIFVLLAKLCEFSFIKIIEDDNFIHYICIIYMKYR